MRRPSLDARAMAVLCRTPLEVAAHLVWKFWRDESPQRAASLAYTTLLSLVPSLAVAFAMLKGFGGLGPIQERLETLVSTHLVSTSSLQAADYIQSFIERVHAGAIGTAGAYLPRRAPASVKVVELWRALGGRIAGSDGDLLDRLLAGAADATA